jgi:diadenosine tetraphosphate (Ap4A) HIT family hydrolase
MSELPDCLYCRKDQRLKDLMIEVAPMSVSTLYLFREQTHRGRCVVAYGSHVNELYELPDTELTMFMRDVTRAAKALKHAFGPAKINYGAYSDKLPHLHMHLVPKYEGGAAWGAPFEMMPANRQLLSDEEYVGIISKIKAAL